MEPAKQQDIKKLLNNIVPRAQRARNVALTSFSVLVLGALRAPSEQGRFTNIWMAVRRLRLLPSI